MGLTVTIYSAGADGEQFEISLERTMADKGFIRVKSWAQGQDPTTVAPRKDDLVKLYDVRSPSDWAISCRGEVLGPDPVLTCLLLQGEGKTPSVVQVKVEGSWMRMFDGITTYPLSRDDFGKLGTFFAQAGFPQA